LDDISPFQFGETADNIVGHVRLHKHGLPNTTYHLSCRKAVFRQPIMSMLGYPNFTGIDKEDAPGVKKSVRPLPASLRPGRRLPAAG
jgi:hypothetical protein